MKYKYAIMQGVMSASGCGDYYEVACGSNLKEARKLFNKLKRDTKDWIKNGSGSYLETVLKRRYDDYSYRDIDYFKIDL